MQASFRRRARLLMVILAGLLCLLLECAPAACAASGSGRGALIPFGFLGLPSLHEIIESIAKGFFSALAGALIPSWLKHGTVATIQHLVALPDLASWGHVNELEGDMTWLGMSLMPVTLAVCTMRYWMMGLTGGAHPVSALVRCACATGMLVLYRWLVEQTVAATNTITHAILGFSVVANGLASIITVLFGGALLIGAGGVFGALLVIVGVIFAASMFACAEALTVLLALVFCVGPPLIALAPIPELSHLARAWSHALIAIVLVPVGWTILFAVAGALTLDATSVTHGAGGLPGHVAAAFAGLITFILAVKLPLMLFGELRHILGGAMAGGGSAASTGSWGTSSVPGAERARAAKARLRSLAFDAGPALGGSIGRAAGALGAPEGGPLGAARRGLAGAAARTGLISKVTPAGVAAGAGAGAASVGGRSAGRVASSRSGVRERWARARQILADAPREASVAMAGVGLGVREAARAGRGAGSARTGKGAATRDTRARVASTRRATRTSATAGNMPGSGGAGGLRATRQPRSQPPQHAKPRAQTQTSTAAPPPQATGGGASKLHPGRKVSSSAEREARARTHTAPDRPRPTPLAVEPPKPRAAGSGRPAPSASPPGGQSPPGGLGTRQRSNP